ncbi:hypothetical protein AJ80_03797 [Polytolypa hystricis UAMH7299]|uniref:FAD-binding PCMH-type domain-containing protein n=1 Tax=Polytolypa hystricis (strain UAMH7299) TaxID=1447883 RepID=A0A2B7YG39_POLH7|nr:hypothetical protein AJ80_03797 [Polytolypa hystricis UAMH7299]
MSPLLSKHLLSFLLAGSSLLQGALAIPAAELARRSLKTCVTSALQGSDIARRVVLPSDDTWPDASVGAMIKPETPAIIAFAFDADEIPALLQCATSHGKRAVPRSGRHHFESWSALNDTLVIDVAHIDDVTLSTDLQTATVGAGASLGKIYTLLSQQGKALVGGICPTVGIGGYLGTGGYSLQVRKLGMAVDHMVSFRIITADGNFLTVSPTSHPDLWWAARGGGQFGIIVDAVFHTYTLPRSSMVTIHFPDPTTRFLATKTWHNWAPRQVGEFTSQFNLYSDRSQFIGWYLGGTQAQLQAILDESGLLDIPGAEVYIDGDCSTENSRMFWIDGTNECTQDGPAYTNFLESYNTPPIHLVPIQPELRFEDDPPVPTGPLADLWHRYDVTSKTYFVLKSNPLSEATLEEFVDRSGALPAEAGFWAEITSFNITAPPTTGSFPWQDDAYVLQRVQVAGGEANKAWLNDFDDFYRPEVGGASYSGYIDSTIGQNSNPYTAYYGDNICRLIDVKNQYDPTDFFKNPFSIPTSAPAGITC